MLPQDYALRRERLMDIIPEKVALALIFGNEPFQRLPTIKHRFIQNADLVYLSGYNHPSGVLAMLKEVNKMTSVLFLPPRDPNYELWNGKRIPFEDAQLSSAVDKVLPIGEFNDWVRKNAPKHRTVYGSPSNTEPLMHGVKPISKHLETLRIIKSPKELDYIRQSIEITNNSIKSALNMTKPGTNELQIESYFRLNAVQNGACGFSFTPNVGVGVNTCYNQHRATTRAVRDGEVVLVDGAAEVEHYTCNIAKTRAVGELPPAHLNILRMVFDIKETLVRTVRRGNILTLEHLQLRAENMLGKVLREYEMSSGPSEMRMVCPHGVSHWVGLDPYDTPSIPQSTPLAPGMVFAIKPALYFDPKNADVPDELRGLGVRFSDTYIMQ